jgi:hypothetical protein
VIADTVQTAQLIITGAVISFAFLSTLASITVVAIGVAAYRFTARWRRRRRADGHDVGPDTLLLLEDLDAHLDEHVATDPYLAAGFARLRAAVRDEQEREGRRDA